MQSSLYSLLMATKKEYDWLTILMAVLLLVLIIWFIVKLFQ